jgi:hypothetical protein
MGGRGMSEKLWLYFGCFQEVGHYLWEPGKVSPHKIYGSRRFNFDGMLCPDDRAPYVAALSRLGGLGYSALAFWDYSVDRRAGSNSIFFAPSLTCSAETIIAGAQQYFPQVWQRLPGLALDRNEEGKDETALLRAGIAELEASINTPETADFMKGVPLEAAHQRERWGVDHDAGKSAFDWFWLIGYLAQKAATSEVRGDVEKAKHHAISTAAALANWHLRLSGGDNRMRPGIDPTTVGEQA